MIQGDSPELMEHVVKTNFSAYEKGDHFNTALGDIFGKGRKGFLIFLSSICMGL